MCGIVVRQVVSHEPLVDAPELHHLPLILGVDPFLLLQILGVSLAVDDRPSVSRAHLHPRHHQGRSRCESQVQTGLAEAEAALSHRAGVHQVVTGVVVHRDRLEREGRHEAAHGMLRGELLPERGDEEVRGLQVEAEEVVDDRDERGHRRTEPKLGQRPPWLAGLGRHRWLHAVLRQWAQALVDDHHGSPAHVEVGVAPVPRVAVAHGQRRELVGPDDVIPGIANYLGLHAVRPKAVQAEAH
mmetsp:Transcript_110668/g.308355  ORF Transcript_110668/g.308355 Transcript_110668/m.308355 type:complete len:242 (+) Transcript_110668:603-1328(+)